MNEVRCECFPVSLYPAYPTNAECLPSCADDLDVSFPLEACADMIVMRFMCIAGTRFCGELYLELCASFEHQQVMHQQTV